MTRVGGVVVSFEETGGFWLASDKWRDVALISCQGSCPEVSNSGILSGPRLGREGWTCSGVFTDPKRSARPFAII